MMLLENSCRGGFREVICGMRILWLNPPLHPTHQELTNSIIYSLADVGNKR